MTRVFNFVLWSSCPFQGILRYYIYIGFAKWDLSSLFCWHTQLLSARVRQPPTIVIRILKQNRAWAKTPEFRFLDGSRYEQKRPSSRRFMRSLITWPWPDLISYVFRMKWLRELRSLRHRVREKIETNSFFLGIERAAKEMNYDHIL